MKLLRAYTREAFMQRHAISYQHKVMTFEPNIVPHTSNIRSSEPKLLFEIYSTPEIAVEYILTQMYVHIIE